MKKHLVVPALAGVFLFGSCNMKKEEVELVSQSDKVSYSLGISIGQNIKKQGIDTLNIEVFAKALEDVYAESTFLIGEEEGNQLIQDYFAAKASAAAGKNVQAGVDFLADNSKREGVVTLPSGLQYEVMTEGDGAKPTLQDNVTTHYHGTLIDGTVFDSSVDRDEPASFPVGGVIKGWTEALQLMPVGSKWKLFVPSDLAYGERGAGGKIGPNSTLVFEVELLKIN
ncbi:MAG: FKBP-type peptidyl-prolyl cis-trans isomerase FklB [Sphingobacteriales bacterium]|jgi:FKBP-type peptidyl-prolyl cis-trans isomerase FklB